MESADSLFCELEVVVSRWRSVIAVSMNAAGGDRLKTRNKMTWEKLFSKNLSFYRMNVNL